jgi:outer membrane protein assembly factor BamB
MHGKVTIRGERMELKINLSFFRISLIFALLFTILGFTIAAKSFANTYPAKWSMYAMNSEHNPVYENGSNLDVNWTFGVPEAISSSMSKNDFKKKYFNPTTVRDIMGIPIGVSIVNGIVYAPCDDNNLYALNANTGKLIWKFDALNQLMGTPAVVHGIVYIGAGNSVFAYSQAKKFAYQNSNVIRGVDVSAFYALNAKTGKLIWEYHTKGEDMPTPVYYRNELIFGNGDGHIYCLNAKTGKLLWRIYISSFVSMSSAVRYKNIVLINGTHPNYFYAVNVNTGKLIWKVKPAHCFSSSSGDGSPAVSKNGIAVNQIEIPGLKAGTSSSEEIALNVKNGRILWTTILGSGAVPPRNKDAVPMIHKGIIYTGSPVTKKAYAVNLKTGKILWSKKIIRMKAAPVILGYKVYFPTGNGTIFVLNKDNGHIISKFNAHNGGYGPQDAVIIGKTMIIGTNFGWVNAIPLSKL